MGIEQILTKYNIYLALASLLWAVLTLTSDRAVDTKPLVFMFYMYTFTTIFGFGFSDLNTIHVDSFDFKFWANLLCLSILGTTFSTSMYFIGVEKLGSREASSFVFLVPFISMFFAWMFLGEHITIVEIGGTALTIFAVIILNSKEVPLIGKYLQKKF